MRVPNWFKIAWWILLTAVLTWVLSRRYSDLVSGNATPIDALFLIVWVGLMLMPLFQEVELLGFKFKQFKQEVDSLKSFVAAQVSDIRNEVKSAVDVSTTVSPQITIPLPPSDAQLPDLEARIKRVLSEVLTERGLAVDRPEVSPVSPPDDVSFLFGIRYGIEMELKRLARLRDIVPPGRRVAPITLVRPLVEAGLIENGLDTAIREVYAVCSPAIHGEPVTAAQINFARDIGPRLLTTLQSIK